jgi:hypothetical protein
VLALCLCLGGATSGEAQSEDASLTGTGILFFGGSAMKNPRCQETEFNRSRRLV